MESRKEQIPKDEEDIFENPDSDEEAEEINNAEKLRRYPWHEEDPENLIIIGAALKHISKRRPPEEKAKFVELAVGGADRLRACAAKDDGKAFSSSPVQS